MNIPTELSSMPHWVGWKTSGGKKIPINPKTGKAGSSTNPDTWASLDEANTAKAKFNLDGIGFVLTGNGVVVLDLDHSIINGAPSPLASLIIREFDSLTEISPSGTGIHVFVRGRLPRGNISSALSQYGIEAYEDKRYITWTGNKWDGSPDEIHERQDKLDLLPQYVELAKSVFAVIHAEPGTGNQVLNNETFKIVRDTDIGLDDIKEIMVSAAITNGRRPEAEARNTVESALKAGNLAANQKILAAQESTGDWFHADNLEKTLEGKIRYANHSGRWMTYTDGKWVPIEDEQMANIAAEKLLQHYSGLLSTAKGKTEIHYYTSLVREACSNVKIKLALQFLKGRVIVPLENWDRDHFLLNFKNGTLELETMRFREHRPDDLLTKQIDCPYDPTASCPTWEQTLEFALDKETIPYFQRAMGYSLSGDVSAQAMFVAWGANGFNGKTTLIEGFARALGSDYAISADPSMIVGRGENDLIKLSQIAQMVGIRFVHMSEMGAGQRLNENFVKQITGGDTITGKFYHKNTFTFVPVSKLWVRTNDVPTVQSTGPAIWRRMKLIPFERAIPEAQRRGMGDVFKDFDKERAGILAWAIRGWEDFRKNGLQEPAAVTNAVREYRDESDYVKTFLTENVEFDEKWPERKILLNELHRRYRGWVSSNNLEHSPISARSLAARLRTMGIKVDNGGGNKMTVFGARFTGDPDPIVDYSDLF